MLGVLSILYLVPTGAWRLRPSTLASGREACGNVAEREGGDQHEKRDEDDRRCAVKKQRALTEATCSPSLPSQRPSAAARALLAVAGGQARRRIFGLPRLLVDERVAQSRERPAEWFARPSEPVEQRRGVARHLAIDRFERLASVGGQGEARVAAVGLLAPLLDDSLGEQRGDPLAHQDLLMSRSSPTSPWVGSGSSRTAIATRNSG